MKHRKKLISNKTFSSIWDAASRAGSYRELCNMAYTSKYFNPTYLENNNGISLEELYIILENVYTAYNMTFEEIMSKAKTTNSKLRDCFCIPEKSIEAWKSGRNKCPDYIRLMIQRYYHLINLGKYIYTEEYDNFLNTIPKVYVESDPKKQNNKEKKSFVKKGINERTQKYNNEVYTEGNSDSEEDYFDSEEDDFNELINSLPSLKLGTGLYNDNRSYNKKSSIVNKTEYLDDILKKRKR